jgi:hypothetical protein
LKERRLAMIKKIVIFLIILSLTLVGITFSPHRVSAYDSDTVTVHDVFIDTLYGMAIGGALAVAYSLANEEKGAENWGRNIGFGAVFGGVLGAAYGITMEYRGLAEIKRNTVSFHIPAIALSPSPHTGEMALHTNLLKYSF